MRDALHRSIAGLATRRPGLILLAASLLAILGSLWAVRDLRVNADTDDLIGEDRPWMRDYRAFLEEFGDLEDLVIAVDGHGDTSAAQRCVDDLARELDDLERFPKIRARIEPREQRRLATRAMPEDELAELVPLAAVYPLLRSEEGLARQLARASQGLLVATKPDVDPAERERFATAGVTFLELTARALGKGGRLGELEPLIARPAPRYLRSETGRLHFLLIKAQKDYGTLEVIEAPLAAIREVLSRARKRHPKVDIGLTGKPVLQADEMTTTDRDMRRASIVAILLVGTAFMLVMREIRRPFLALLALLVGIAWTFGWATLAVGQLNLLSMVFTLVLVAVGIDFGVHFIGRYREEIVRHPLETALSRALVGAGRGNLTGAVTSSLAFLATLFTDFRGLQELGIIAGGGIFLCLVAMTTVLPALIAGTEGRRSPTVRKRADPAPPLITARRPRATIALAGVLTLITISAAFELRFEDNILELQADDLDSVRWEHRILEDSAAASWFGASIASSRAEVAERRRRAASEPVIGATNSIADITAPPTPKRRFLRDRIARNAEAPLPPAPPSDFADPLHELRQAAGRLEGLASLAHAGGRESETRELSSLSTRLGALGDSLADDPDRTQRLRATADRLYALGTSLEPLIAGNRAPLRQALPYALRDRFISPDGRYLVALYPRDNVWETANMRAFVAALRRVDPEVTGVPITHLESIDDMKSGFQRAALLAFAAVLALIAIDFRRLRPAALALVPLLCGGLWLTGSMGHLGLHFNLANFFAVPILIGIGVDNGIHLVHRLRESPADARRFTGTHRAVLLTSLTSMIGFGSLTLASHQGLRSLGQVMALGCALLLLASLFVLPALAREGRKKS